MEQLEYKDGEILLYDLRNRPASYDFVTCLASSIALGIKHVRFVYGRGFKPKNYTLKQAEERWQAIVEPAPALFGVSYSVGDPKGVEISHMLRAAIEIHNRTGRMGRIQALCIPKDYVTLTLRKSRNPERDSNEEESRKFARSCDRKVIIIPDWDEEPISLEDRMSLYAGAYLNMMVMNGPATLCFHSDAPYVILRTIGCEQSGSTSPEFSKRNGITPGFQFPWAKEHQKMSYLQDTAENLWLEYESMKKIIDEKRAA